LLSAAKARLAKGLMSPTGVAMSVASRFPLFRQNPETIADLSVIGITLLSSALEELADIKGVVGLKQGDLASAAIDRIANVR
jgi:hypothetical protein